MVMKVEVCNCDNCDILHSEDEDMGEDSTYCRPESKFMYKCSKCTMCFDDMEEAKDHQKYCEKKVVIAKR